MERFSIRGFVNRKQPLLIAGPCGVGSETQVMNTLEPLALSGKVHLIRAGFWKPRTRPNSFEGPGEAVS